MKLKQNRETARDSFRLVSASLAYLFAVIYLHVENYAKKAETA